MTIREQHGDSRTKLYSSWLNMKSRCYGYAKSFERDTYNDLEVCDAWRFSYTTFKGWALSAGYSDGLSLDRVNNSLGYFPENCRWATVTVQNQNQRMLKSTNTSGFKGVYYYKNRNKPWWAYISVDSKRESLGYFHSPYEAANAYNSYVINNNLEHTLNTLTSESFKYYCASLGDLAKSMGTPEVSKDIIQCLRHLKGMGELHGCTLLECLEVAYNDIKDRKGLMRDGIFLKEGDY